VLEPQDKIICEYKWDHNACCHRYESFIFYFTLKIMFTQASTNLTYHKQQQQKTLLFNSIFLLFCLLHLCRIICVSAILLFCSQCIWMSFSLLLMNAYLCNSNYFYFLAKAFLMYEWFWSSYCLLTISFWDCNGPL